MFDDYDERTDLYIEINDLVAECYRLESECKELEQDRDFWYLRYKQFKELVKGAFGG